MARGWESKSVEAQQDEAAGRTTSEKPRLTRKEAAARLREREALRLSLQSVVQRLQRSHDPRHRAMLEQALADLEGKLQALGTTAETVGPSDR